MSYIIEANLGVILFYGIYLVVLEKENDFTKQRVVLLGGIVCALAFPLVQLPVVADAGIAITTITLPEVIVNSSSQTPVNSLFILYTAITTLIAIPIIIHAIRLYRISKNGRGYYRNNYFIVESNENLPSFSFFKLIYIGRANELSTEDKHLVMEHEMHHGRLLHSIDMLLITVLCIVFWFNPVLWFYRRTMAKTHEFEVDSIIARQHGVPGYVELLAKTALSGNGFLLTHHFNQSFILKRINMINSIKNRISNWRIAVLACAFAGYFVFAACTDQQVAAGEVQEVVAMVDETAQPKDGMTAFYEELSAVLSYPAQARTMGIEGKVYIEFLVDESGKLSDFKVVKGIGAGCDAAAVDALAKVSNWKPAVEKGKVVQQRLVLPIAFKLN